MGPTQARAKLLVMLGGKTKPVLAEMTKAIAAKSEPATWYHLDRLIKEGLVEKLGQGDYRLTPQGKTVRGYLAAAQLGEGCFRKMVKKFFGSYTREAARAVVTAAKDMDATYALNREGLHRKTSKGSKELERKTDYADLIQALKTCATLVEVASRIGLTEGALNARINKTLIPNAKAILASGAQ